MRTLATILLLALCGAVWGQAAPRDPNKPNWMTLPTDEAAQRTYFTDLPLLNQDGQRVRFYSDVLKDRVVMINFIFTHCRSACPALAKTFSKVQTELGQRLGRDVHLVSLSVDAERDTPEILKRWSQQFDAKTGWTLLTGKKENVDWVIHKLGQWNEDFDKHSPLILLADVKKGRWQFMHGAAPPHVLVAQLTKLSTR
jgi:cytochrome oxidase Cu insertion factor (SCO1/SenC/PrrC family)